MRLGLLVLASGCCVIGALSTAAAQEHGDACGCGKHSSVPTVFEIDHVLEAWQQSAMAAFSRWDTYSDLFTFALGDGAGGSNGKNEVIFFDAAITLSQYGIAIDDDIFGVTYINPLSAFGTPPFNACPAPAGTTCGTFTETDVIMNAEFARGWTTAPPNFDDTGPANYLATALHEIGHTLGLHHNFDSLTTMNYYEDFAGQHLGLSDGVAAREFFPSQARTVVDIATFPFRQDGFQYAGTSVASGSPTTVQHGEYLTVRDFTVENLGSETVAEARLRFYLSADAAIADTDHLLGTLGWTTFETWWDSTGTDLYVPSSVPPGTYYLGAIFSYELDQQDGITHNNSWVLDASRRISVASGCTDDAYESIGSSDSDDVCFGKYMDLGQLEDHQHCDEDWVYFYGVAGRTYRIETSGLSGFADTVLHLHYDCGEELAVNDDYLGLESRIDWTATADGPYDIRIREFGDYYSGPLGYSVRVTCIANCADVTLPDDLLIERKTYAAGVTVEEACSSITARDKVYVPPGADVTWRAPQVSMGNLVIVAVGGDLAVDTSAPAGCSPGALKAAQETRR